MTKKTTNTNLLKIAIFVLVTLTACKIEYSYYWELKPRYSAKPGFYNDFIYIHNSNVIYFNHSIANGYLLGEIKDSFVEFNNSKLCNKLFELNKIHKDSFYVFNFRNLNTLKTSEQLYFYINNTKLLSIDGSSKHDNQFKLKHPFSDSLIVKITYHNKEHSSYIEPRIDKYYHSINNIKGAEYKVDIKHFVLMKDFTQMTDSTRQKIQFTGPNNDTIAIGQYKKLYRHNNGLIYLEKVGNQFKLIKKLKK
jgi:hypothetical protein